jgi:hypothetical protein
MVAAIRPVVAQSSFKYNSRMRKLILILLLASATCACGDITIGPVDHSCHSNPSRGADSGCGGGGGSGH